MIIYRLYTISSEKVGASTFPDECPSVVKCRSERQVNQENRSHNLYNPYINHDNKSQYILPLAIYTLVCSLFDTHIALLWVSLLSDWSSLKKYKFIGRFEQ
jgi:hypothetical protein